jgi:hypothetical protein
MESPTSSFIPVRKREKLDQREELNLLYLPK